MSFSIHFRRSVAKDMRRIPEAMLRRIEYAIDSLKTEPHPADCKSIQGYKNHFRLRVGQYRVIYEIAAQIHIITIIRIGHRKDIYRDL